MGFDIPLKKYAFTAHWDHMDMEEELERLFGRPVDLVSKRALKNPFRRHEILTTRQVIYAA